MPDIPHPSTAKALRGKTHGVYQLAKSKRSVSLLLLLTLCSLFYLVDVGPLIHSRVSPPGPEVPVVPAPGSPPPVWPNIGVINTNSGTGGSSKPLTSLGLDADNSYHLGSISKAVYKAELEQFVMRAFPEALQKRALASIDLYLSDSSKVLTFPEVPHRIYQTAKVEPRWDHSTWRNVPGYTHFFYDDEGATKWVHDAYGGTEVEKVWEALGRGVKQSDFLRYLLVMTEGGIYSDMDTRRLKDISNWGRGAEPRGPAGTGAPSVFVGVEADVGTRPDWHQWWPRPLQIVQWTFAAAPFHPILIDAVRRVHFATALVETTKSAKKSNATELHWVGGELLRDDGTVSIMEWTGPGLFTDSVIRYLAVEANIKWPELKSLRKPIRVRDVAVLPVTGFSPGVGMFGAGDTGNEEAMVQHMFSGSWKTGKGGE